MILDLFASPAGLIVGLVAAFGAIAALFVLLAPQRTEAEALGAALKSYSAAGGAKRTLRGTIDSLVFRFTGFLDRIPRPRRSEGSIEANLELAGWPLRSSEFLAVRVVAVPVGALLGYTVFGHWFMAAAVAIGSFFAPRVLLRQRMDKRTELFRNQLPDTLTTLAASLEAGYGFQQSMDAVAQEAPAPTSNEFGKALAQIRLGMSVSEALDSLADRIGGEEFRWVVLAVNVQREVGGNLSSVLHSVADTIREREQVLRQVKVLSAEGRISAAILTILPFALAAYMIVVNPTYLGTMILSQAGRIMLLFALGLLVAGGFWLKKLVKIEV